MARKRKNQRKLSGAPRLLLVAALLALASVGGAAWWFLHSAPGQGRVVLLSVEPGSSLPQVSAELQNLGLVRQGRAFALYARLTGKDRSIRAGEYELRDDMRPAELLEALCTGRGIAHKLTVPEGYDLRQIAALFEREGIAPAGRVLELSRDRALLDELGVDADSLEGYLFPETYFYQRLEGPEKLLSAMVQQLEQVYTPQWQLRAQELGMTRRQILTLASLIEKETGLDEERPLVSSVFHQRLQHNIALACDPTVIYGLGRFDGNLTRAHLRDRTNRYNTYAHKGLPPGPIASPGSKSIEAALYPADVPYLYFVSRNDGSHEFSSTLAEHNRAVQRFQRVGAGGDGR